MRLPVFWHPDPGGNVGDHRGSLRLDGPEGHHAAVVRRIAVGEWVRLTDGRGRYAEGVVTAADRRGVDVRVERHGVEPAPTLTLTVVQAVPKGERAEIAVQALVEVGVDRVVPWAAERSQVRLSGERGEKLVAKWRAWAGEASKQARRTWFAAVAEVASTAEVAALLADADAALVLDAAAAQTLGGTALPHTGELVLVVGPEGGIGSSELAVLAAPTVRLGDTVLRTSTAGAVAAGVALAATRWRQSPVPPPVRSPGPPSAPTVVS